MSRDIGDTCVTWSLETPAIGRGLVVGCTAPAARLDEVGREDLAGGERDDRDP